MVTTQSLVHGDVLPGRTKRALEEPMSISLQRTGGVYEVTKGNGTTYIVDILKQTCSCPDTHQRCKHRRRVERELSLDLLPTPDGYLP